ncbi:MAG: accessory factor UbiK family protein [Alphaproteobacteria bacterium]|nr:accessory factor UbiK family protein [Alphaproteobacteria bacterium]
MQTTFKILDDMARLGSGVLGLVLGAKNEMKKKCKAQAEHVARDMDLVTREEFEVVRAMAQKAREENEQLHKKIQDMMEKK